MSEQPDNLADDWFEEDVDEWCETCQGTGYIDCLCGGDLCICENNGDETCPDCGW